MKFEWFSVIYTLNNNYWILKRLAYHIHNAPLHDHVCVYYYNYLKSGNFQVGEMFTIFTIWRALYTEIKYFIWFTPLSSRNSEIFATWKFPLLPSWTRQLLSSIIIHNRKWQLIGHLFVLQDMLHRSILIRQFNCILLQFLCTCSISHGHLKRHGSQVLLIVENIHVSSTTILNVYYDTNTESNQY